jgi:hypothetical protein
MKDIFGLLIVALIPICLFGLSAFLVFNKADGWGWFLFCTVLVCGGISFKTEG